jgi:hypothetical protein
VERNSALSPATTTDSCSLSTSCVIGINSSTGPGVQGNSAFGYGVRGLGRYGVYGEDILAKAFHDAGVYGTSDAGYGVEGVTSTGSGVYGNSTNGSTGTGVYGNSNYRGIYGQGGWYGLESFGGSFGAYMTSNNGTGAVGSSYARVGLEGLSYGAQPAGVGLYGYAQSGNGSDVTGGYVGLLGRSNNYPLALTDANGNSLIYADSFGNLYLHGQVYPQSFARSGGSASTPYVRPSARPSIEDTGTADLVNGQAIIPLNRAITNARDRSRPYQVFLTPGGDTRGLYVANKNASFFVVREVQGGHGTFTFDYHVYAPALSAAGMPPGVAPPDTPVVRPPAARPQKSRG